MADEPEVREGRRRWPFVVASALVLLLGLVSLWWFWWVPNWRPPLGQGEQYCVDVSAHQNVIDWAQVAQDGISFAYIKATEGADFVDERFNRNWKGAAKAGLNRGAYHFFTLCSPGDAQAAHFLRVVPPDSTALPPAVDLELGGNCSRRPTRAEIEGELGKFLDRVEAAWTRQMVLYIGDDFEGLYHMRRELQRPLWHRRFLRRPDVGGWVIWQVHGFAKVDGVTGGVDLNIMRPTR